MHKQIYIQNLSLFIECIHYFSFISIDSFHFLIPMSYESDSDIAHAFIRMHQFFLTLVTIYVLRLVYSNF